MRLIDVDELIKSIEETTWYHIFKGKLIKGANSETDIPLYKASDIYSVLDAAPTVDAEPVRHGKWKKKKKKKQVPLLVSVQNVITEQLRTVQITAQNAVQRWGD